MAFRLPGARIALDLDGPNVEVEPIRAWAIQRHAMGLYAKIDAAKTADAQLAALIDLYRLIEAEAQPTWDIIDHRGPLPPTASGLLRLPLSLALSLALAWIETYGDEKPETAVDAVIPPGPVRNEVKRRLRSVKAA